ncbi:MAG: aldehyde ferredoxin oxidoreductase C-terminal domain-containing protein, partial [Halobaculum sp.]
KAVVARGDPPSGLDDLRERFRRRFDDSATGDWLATSGTVETVDFTNETGILPTRGWQGGQFEDAVEIGVEAISRLSSEREHPDRDRPGGFRV